MFVTVYFVSSTEPKPSAFAILSYFVSIGGIAHATIDLAEKFNKWFNSKLK
jgi:hypothetical protein